MENNTITKINKLGKVGYVICKVGRILMIIAAVACLVGAILMCFVPKEAVKFELISKNSVVLHLDDNADFIKTFDLDTEDALLKIGEHSYQIVMDEEDASLTSKTVFYLSSLKWVLFAAVVAIGVFYVALYFAGKLCEQFKNCNTPFTEGIAKGLTTLAWSMIPLCLIGNFMQAVCVAVFGGDADIVLGVNLATVLLILCMFMLSFIFKYGAALQIESDETL